MEHFYRKAIAVCVFATMAVFTSLSAQADTINIAQNSTADVGNFQNPGSTAQVGYSIQTSDDGTNFTFCS